MGLVGRKRPPAQSNQRVESKDSITIYQSSIARYAGYKIRKFLSLWSRPPRGVGPETLGLPKWRAALAFVRFSLPGRKKGTSRRSAFILK